MFFNDGLLQKQRPEKIKDFIGIASEDAGTIARWEKATYARFQLRHLSINRITGEWAEPQESERPMQQDKSAETWLSMLQNSFHAGFAEDDIYGTSKRCAIVLVTDQWLYIRLLSEENKAAPRYPMGNYGRHDLLSPARKPILEMYKDGITALPFGNEEDVARSLNLLDAVWGEHHIALATTVYSYQPDDTIKVLETRPVLGCIDASTAVVVPAKVLQWRPAAAITTCDELGGCLLHGLPDLVCL